jgi:anti-sigma regulatory factor (Ser/Thr protein kinase)
MKRENAVTVRNQIAEVASLRQFVSDFWLENRLLPDLEFDVNLALEEAFINIVQHAFDDRRDHEILVRIALEDGWITLTVDDDGRPFDPMQAVPPDIRSPLGERPIGGLGIHLIKNVVDKVEYVRKEGRNCLVMKKKGQRSYE